MRSVLRTISARGATSSGWTVCLGVVIFVDVLRVFLPSLITIFGRAGGTPAEFIGLFAVAWFLGPFVAIGLARLFGARPVAVVSAVLLISGRVGLLFSDGGDTQLYVASVALLGGLCWLTATAMAATDLRPFAGGLVGGLALATVLHAAFDSVALVWRSDVLSLVLVVLVLLAFFISLRPTPARALDADTARVPGTGESASAARGWLAVGPALLLWGLYTGNTAHAQASAGWSALPAAIVVAVAGILAIAVVLQPRRYTRHPTVAAAALVASSAAFAYGEVTVAGVHGVAPWWTVLAQVVGALALAGCLGWAATAGAKQTAGASQYRNGVATAAGLLLFVIGTFAYYAAYDLFLPNNYVPILAAAVIALVGVAGVNRQPAEAPGFTVLLRTAGAAALAVLVIAAGGLLTAVPAITSQPPADGLRVAAYNIRMGFGLDGTLSLADQADALRGLNAHVIALSEVDRAWLLNGGHDDLRQIAKRLDMDYVWAPATDEVWGDALLTDLPITSVRNHVLVQGGPTGAQALEVTVRWNDRNITVIATHLQPPSGWRELDQVEQLADIVRAAPKPVVVAGDLNLEPGDPAWDALIAAGLTDPFAPVRPFNTIPSPGEAQQIDHVLVTAGFVGRDHANPDVPFSDHRPIAVTLVAS